MKILIPIIGFAKAGGYRVLSLLANEWQALGHTVFFLVDERTTEPYFPTDVNIIYFDQLGRLKSEKNKAISFKSSGNAFSIYIGMWLALSRLAKEYDVIFANHSMTTFPVSFAFSGAAKKFYYIQAYEPEYYELEEGLRARVLQKLSVLSYKLPLKKIVNSPIYLNYKEIKTELWIPPGLDPALYYRRADIPDLLESKKIVLGTIGRSELTKGTLYALEAFEKMAESDSRIHLKIAYGNLPKGWSHPRAEVVVPKNDAELAEYYRSIDILLAPGIVQLGACHYPVLEAMACGTPVITTGYLPADNENAWIVPIKNSEAIVLAIEEVISLDSHALNEYLNKASVAIDPFMWKNIANQFLKCFSSLDS